MLRRCRPTSAAMRCVAVGVPARADFATAGPRGISSCRGGRATEGGNRATCHELTRAILAELQQWQQELSRHHRRPFRAAIRQIRTNRSKCAMSGGPRTSSSWVRSRVVPGGPRWSSVAAVQTRAAEASHSRVRVPDCTFVQGNEHESTYFGSATTPEFIDSEYRLVVANRRQILRWCGTHPPRLTGAC